MYGPHQMGERQPAGICLNFFAGFAPSRAQLRILGLSPGGIDAETLRKMGRNPLPDSVRCSGLRYLPA